MMVTFECQHGHSFDVYKPALKEYNTMYYKFKQEMHTCIARRDSHESGELE